MEYGKPHHRRAVISNLNALDGYPSHHLKGALQAIQLVIIAIFAGKTTGKPMAVSATESGSSTLLLPVVIIVVVIATVIVAAASAIAARRLA